MAYELKHRTAKTVTAGDYFPLGATLTADGVNFALYSRNAQEVFLLLFDAPDGEPTDVIQLRERDQVRLARARRRRPRRAALRLQGARRVPARAGPALQRRTSCCSIPTPRR